MPRGRVEGVREVGWRRVTGLDVDLAKKLLRAGWSLREVATHLWVSTGDLDVALWRWTGVG